MFHFHRLKGGNVIFVSGIWGTSLAVLALEPRQSVECRLLPFYISIWWYIRHNLDAKHMYRHIYIYIYCFKMHIYIFCSTHKLCQIQVLCSPSVGWWVFLGLKKSISPRRWWILKLAYHPEVWVWMLGLQLRFPEQPNPPHVTNPKRNQRWINKPLIRPAVFRGEVL